MQGRNIAQSLAAPWLRAAGRSTRSGRGLATAVSPPSSTPFPDTEAASGPSQSTDAGPASASASTSSLAELSPSPAASRERRAPSPLPAHLASVAQTIHLPNIIIRLVRNGPSEAHNPYIATFRVPVQLTKPDIVSYLAQVYGLKVTSINTVVEMGDIIRRQPGTYKAKHRQKQTKKALVGLEEPFWFPEPRSKKWLDENFEKWVQFRFLSIILALIYRSQGHTRKLPAPQTAARRRRWTRQRQTLVEMEGIRRKDAGRRSEVRRHSLPHQGAERPAGRVCAQGGRERADRDDTELPGADRGRGQDDGVNGEVATCAHRVDYADADADVKRKLV
jgi:ribosomal protein L23